MKLLGLCDESDDCIVVVVPRHQEVPPRQSLLRMWGMSTSDDQSSASVLHERYQDRQPRQPEKLESESESECGPSFSS